MHQRRDAHVVRLPPRGGRRRRSGACMRPSPGTEECIELLAWDTLRQIHNHRSTITDRITDDRSQIGSLTGSPIGSQIRSQIGSPIGISDPITYRSDHRLITDRLQFVSQIGSPIGSQIGSQIVSYIGSSVCITDRISDRRTPLAPLFGIIRPPRPQRGSLAAFFTEVTFIAPPLACIYSMQVHCWSRIKLYWSGHLDFMIKIAVNIGPGRPCSNSHAASLLPHWDELYSFQWKVSSGNFPLVLQRPAELDSQWRRADRTRPPSGRAEGMILPWCTWRSRPQRSRRSLTGRRGRRLASEELCVAPWVLGLAGGCAGGHRSPSGSCWFSTSVIRPWASNLWHSWHA